MRVLVLSNMLPSPAHPSFGVFVARRIASYRTLGVEVDVAANVDTEKGVVNVASKYLRLLFVGISKGLRRRPEVIEAHYLYPTAIVAAIVGLVVRRPFVLVAHGSDVHLDHRRAVERIVRWAVGRSSRVIANSPATAATVERRYPGCTVVVIPPGVVSSGLPKTLGGSPMVGFVGTLAEHKGPDVLLEALAALPPNGGARIVGDGPQREMLQRRAAELGIADRVEFLGTVAPDALDGFYRSIDVLAVPSRREGFGLVAAEALASGTPIVVSDVGGLPTIPTDDCGSVVPSEDANALASAISKWLERRGDESVADACRKRAAIFDEVGLARQALELLESVAE